MTPEQLLELKLEGNTTLRAVLIGEMLEGQLDFGDLSDEEVMLLIAQKIIDAVRGAK